MMVLMSMLGLAHAGDVWLQVDDADRHLEVPATWLVADDGTTTLQTADGPLDLNAEVARLGKQPEGTRAQWKLKQGLLTLDHRAVAEPVAESIDVRIGTGLTISLALGEDSAKLAASSIDADVMVDGLAIRIQEDDLLAPLRRARPTLLYSAVTKKGKPVHVELK
ncbi:MAG: hypothetical protein H6737_10160 [Alphaproteobacteria bacterium]|nr:hypothetical protein [Alphaproteobacteria bacterium]